jgi:hypothetical protein
MEKKLHQFCKEETLIASDSEFQCEAKSTCELNEDKPRKQEGWLTETAKFRLCA